MRIHLLFSVPHELVPLIWQNKRLLFSLLFEASAATLLEVFADPKHRGVQTGFLPILHTWGQTLTAHPHIHCVVPGGGLAADRSRWIASRSRFLLSVKVLSRVFRGKFVAGLRRLFARDQLRFFGECVPLHRSDSPSSCARSIGKTGSSMPSRPSTAPNIGVSQQEICLPLTSSTRCNGHAYSDKNPIANFLPRSRQRLPSNRSIRPAPRCLLQLIAPDRAEQIR